LRGFRDAPRKIRRDRDPSRPVSARVGKFGSSELVAARDAGVVIAMGFDSGPPGANLLELVRMADGGLGSMAAPAAATSGSAAPVGMAELGRLRPGAPADLVVIDGDPVADLRVLVHPDRIGLVIRDGAVVAGRDLEPSRG
jgi:imidazolonepropionase-like amidohydrolase